jgi:hypothetical protein
VSPAAAAAADAPAGRRRYRVAFSLERAFGVTAYEQTVEQDGVKVTTSGEDVSFLGSSATNTHSVPRLAVDAILGSGVTLGGALALGTSTARQKIELTDYAGSETDELGEDSWVLFTPRVGYLAWNSPHFALWPRAGLTFISVEHTPDGEEESSVKANLSMLNAELQLVASPAEHFAFTIGVAGDIGLGGSSEVEDEYGDTTSVDTKSSGFGVVFGLMGYL